METTGSATRPTPIVWAIIFTVINAVGGVIYTAVTPDLGDRATVVTVSAVAAGLLLAAGWFLWNGARWAAIATAVLNGLNILMSVPAYFEADTAFAIGGTVSIILSVLTIALVLSPAARAFWNIGRRPLAA
jgi:hypothetical protein